MGIKPPLGVTDPARQYFEGRGYIYQPACPSYTNQFSHRIFDGLNTKYSLLWQLCIQDCGRYGKKETWQCWMIASTMWVKFVKDSLNDVPEVEEQCERLYKLMNIPPLFIDKRE